MNTKYLAIALVIIIIVGSALGYLAYNGTFSPSSKVSPTPSPAPTTSPTPSIAPTATPTHSPTAKPSATPTASPIITASPSPTPSPSPSPTYAPSSLTVFAASSLTNVIANMTAAFQNEYNAKITVNSGSSSTLEQQIVAGSPCDVFMSADTKWTNALNSSGLLLNNNATAFTSNSLCVILPPGNPAGITSLADLAKPGIRLVVAATSVPVGSYTNTTVWKIDSTWGNSSSPLYQGTAYQNYNASFYANVKSYETSDSNIVGDVGLNVGQFDAGIVFVSDWSYANLTGSGVQFMAIPSAVNTVGNYGIAVVSETNNANIAQIFMNYWSTTDGQNLLKEFGFGQ
ncbi:MAG: molybdate ABC transporter substrate-binding protein [Candidatus Bathyarchaeia archaeon]